MNWFHLVFLSFWLFNLSVFCQQSYEEWMEIGKYEYHKTFPYNDLNAAENAFKKAIQMNPSSFEAWYRLGLTYQKKYCFQFENIEPFKKNQAVLIADCYKKSIELNKQYSELKDINFEPIELYTQVWGKLAMAYANYNQLDSMKWALKEMSKNFFYEALLEMSQNLLNEIDKNGILWVNNETFYYYLLYCQWILNYRNDVKIIYFEGCNAVWYNVYLQNIYFTNLYLSKDEIEENREVKLLENSLTFSHHQIRSRLEFPFSSQKVIDRANWFFYRVLQNNAFQHSVYSLASFDNDITRAMVNHWHIVGLTKKLFFEIPDKPYEELFQNAKKWKLEKTQAMNGKIPDEILRKLQFYRMPFIFYAYNNINQNNELVKILVLELEKYVPETIIPMQKDIKNFFSQIKQAINQ